MSKNAITVKDQELIDYFDEMLPHCSDVKPTNFPFYKIDELHKMAKDLIEINAELTKRDVSASQCLKVCSDKYEKLQAENTELKKQGQWISVEDELPELNKTVMIDSGFGFDFARFNGDYWTRKAWPLGYTPKHWAPLPTPPEGE